MTHRSLPPLIKWPGGQTRDAARLAKLLPPHRTYVEPFAGGLSVLFAKVPAEREIAGDTDDWLIGFYLQTRLGHLRRCRGGVRVHRGLFTRSKSKNDACHKFALSTTSYDGNRSTYGPSGREGLVAGAQKLRNLDAYERRLRGITLRRSSFESTMRAYDSPTTVHFLDPPWVVEYAERWYHGGARPGGALARRDGSHRGCAFDPVCVAKVATRMKGAVVVIYKDHPRVREAFRKSPWRCRVMMSTRGANVYGSKPIRKLVCQKRARRSR